MDFDIVKIFQKMDVFAKIIAFTLVVFALSSGAVFLERLWAFWRQRKASRDFAPTAASLLDAGDHDKLLQAAKARPESPLARVISAGVSAYLRAKAKPGRVPPVELARRELARQSEELGAQLRRGMSVLASVGSTAPFVGLLGTVVGIIAAFQGIASEGSGGIGAVSAGIAEALVVTALGLVVAIPAVLMFNFLNTKSEKILLGLERSRGELLDQLEASDPGASESSRFAA